MKFHFAQGVYVHSDDTGILHRKRLVCVLSDGGREFGKSALKERLLVSDHVLQVWGCSSAFPGHHGKPWLRDPQLGSASTYSIVISTFCDA